MHAHLLRGSSAGALLLFGIAGASFALLLIFATCILFQMDELYVSVEDTLSLEFQERFNPSTLALTITLLVCLASGLVALAFLMVAQVSAERRRRAGRRRCG